jgi:hypothetical protein
MYLHGQFINKQGDTITVSIITNKDTTNEVIIGDETSGVFFTDDPVNISNETSEPTDIILTESATIDLYTTHFIEDLFQVNALDSTVTIKLNDNVVFNGFIEPQTYSQDFNELYDELEINCISSLSALQYIQYAKVGSEGITYTAAKSKAEQITFHDLILDTIKLINADTKVLYDGSVTCTNGGTKTDVFAQVSINELLFFDDTEDSIWTYEDVLNEVLRYFNLHIRETNGYYYIFNWKSIKDGGTIAWLNIDTLVSKNATHGTVTISTKNVADTNTTITVNEAFNQIQVTCDRKEMEDVAISPFDDDSLTAVFPKRTLYCRQYQFGEDVGTTEAYNKLKDIIQNAGQYYKDDENITIYDWYVQVYKNSAWNFRNCISCIEEENWNTGETDYVDIYENHCTSANDLPLFLDCHWNTTNGVIAGAAIVKFSHSENKCEIGEYGDVQEIKDETTYICIPTNGTSANYNTDRYQKQLERINDIGGMMVCTTATAGGTLSPADSGTTNYIVISGNVLLQGAHVWQLSKTETLRPQKGTSDTTSINKTADNTLLMCTINELLNNGTVNIADPDNPLQRTSDNKWTGRILRFYDSNGKALTTCNHLLPPFEAGERLEYSYNTDHNDWDTVDKVQLLDCMLKVGDKYCVETFIEYTDYKNNKRTKSKFQWLKESECPKYTVQDTDGVSRTYPKKTFSIGINPEIGDCIIGKQYELCNTVTAAMNIDVEGIAIPIKESDALSGKVEFRILGPVNGTWNSVTRRHPTMFRHTTFSDTEKSILDNVSCIYLSDFKVQLYSDNGGVTNGSDDDLVYMSNEDANYKNVKECDDFKINTALTTNEAIDLGVENTTCLSTPTLVSTNKPLLAIYDIEQKEYAKPEQLYVDAYYNEYHKPKVTLSQNFENPQGCISLYNIYSHPALNGKVFYALGADQNLMDGTKTITLREI